MDRDENDWRLDVGKYARWWDRREHERRVEDLKRRRYLRVVRDEDRPPFHPRWNPVGWCWLVVEAKVRRLREWLRRG